MSTVEIPITSEKTAAGELPVPPLPTLIDWSEDPFGSLVALEVRDHPTLGTHRVRDPRYEIIRTSKILWLNRELKMAKTRNTLYRLENELYS